MAWNTHGECWHGNKTQVVEQLIDEQGRTWITEYPGNCKLCEPGKPIISYTKDQRKEEQ